MKYQSFNSLLLTTILCLGTCGQASAQSRRGMIDSFEVSSQTVAGNWSKRNGELKVDGTSGARAVLATSAPKSYSLTVDFTRTSGDDSIGIVLPVGSSQCAFIMSAFKGRGHGIGVVDGKLAIENSTTISPGRLETGHPYRLLIEVEVNGDNAAIDSTLDGRPFLSWKGNPKSLSMLDFWKLPSASCVGLCTYAEATFHRIELGKLDPTMRMTGNQPQTSLPKTVIEFEGRSWSAPQADTISVENFNGKEALHIEGGEENFVFLSEVDFTDGTIDVDIASATFSGIGFRSNSEGTVVEKLYFRPFNSGTAKHNNTVQYSMLGRPEFHWRTLRISEPGKYESGAEIDVNEWFHARIEVSGKRLSVYVDDDPTPVLIVDPVLGDRRSGSIGVWGWDSYFANFRFTPSN